MFWQACTLHLHRSYTRESLVKLKKVMGIEVLWRFEIITDRSNTFNSASSIPWMSIPLASAHTLKEILTNLSLNKKFLGQKIPLGWKILEIDQTATGMIICGIEEVQLVILYRSVWFSGLYEASMSITVFGFTKLSPVMVLCKYTVPPCQNIWAVKKKVRFFSY